LAPAIIRSDAAEKIYADLDTVRNRHLSPSP